jgi:hypothetical protein
MLLTGMAWTISTGAEQLNEATTEPGGHRRDGEQNGTHVAVSVAIWARGVDSLGIAPTFE